MGLQIVTAFTTAHGFPVSSVYCRIKRILYTPIRDPEYTIALEFETHLSREARLAGSLPLSIPGVAPQTTVTGGFGDMTYLYGLLKTSLESQGLVVEDVIEPPPPMDISGSTPEVSQQSSESTQTTPPTLPPPEESQQS